MSKPFNPALNADIKKLHEIPKNTRRNEYKLLFNDVMKRHNISRSALYRELSKETPGQYKTPDRRSRRVRISKHELDLLAGYTASHKSNSEICRLMSVEMGFSYSRVRLLQAKNKLHAFSQEILENKPKIILRVLGNAPVARPFDIHNESEQLSTSPDDGKSAPNGRENLSAADFFFRLSGIDLSDPKAIAALQFGENEYKVSTSVIKECLERIVRSAELGGKSTREMIKFEVESLILNQLSRAKNDYFYNYSQLRHLSMVRANLLSLGSDTKAAKPPSGGYNLDDLLRVVQHFSPSTGREEVIKLLGLQ
ncbi:MAG: hypothetical protein K8I03_04990 [Ignavibacteria bacterium]|nr:hypothetical protein [Ignavibacteria bacterium]